MKNTFVVLSIISLCYISCKPSEDKKHKDPFYSQNMFDRLNIPLIRPYKLIKEDNAEWRLKLQTPKLLTLSINNVKGVDTAGGKILIYSKGGTEANNIQYDEIWFVIEPDSLQERSFESYDEFKKALIKANIENVSLKDPDTLYNERYNK
jgi:hypothetical protein